MKQLDCASTATKAVTAIQAIVAHGIAIPLLIALLWRCGCAARN
jgi:hypothetical protein